MCQRHRSSISESILATQTKEIFLQNPFALSQRKIAPQLQYAEVCNRVILIVIIVVFVVVGRIMFYFPLHVAILLS